MSKLLMLVVLSFAFLAGCTQVPSGYAGVKVYMLGGPKGVDTEVLGTGRYFLGINEQLYLFPTFKQNYVWTQDSREGSETDESISFQTKEGMTVSADLGISYTIEREKVATVFQTYRRGVDEITDTFLHNLVRDAFNDLGSKMSVEDVYGEGKSALLKGVTEKVRGAVAPQGIMVENVYLVNSFRLPENVVKALNSKIEATQRAQQRENEKREAIAEGEKSIAKSDAEAQALLTTAKAQAEANTIISRSLTAELIELKRIERWQGNLPMVVGSGTAVDLRSMMSTASGNK